jgi:histidyl-tRNA synthetase
MTEEKGLAPEVADTIGQYVQKKGGRDLLTELKEIPELTANPSFSDGLSEMELLIDYLEIFKVMPVLSFDLSLARGLDYYTGVIYEVVTEASAPPAKAAGASVAKNKRGPNPPKDDDPDADRSNDDSIGVGSIAAGASVAKNKRGPKPPKDDDPDADRSNDDSIGVGSIAAGGRYDELVGMFANSSKGRIPCVGISFGVDRIFSITKARMMEEVRGNEVDVYVMAFGGKGFNGLVKERMSVCKTLWDANIKVSFSFIHYFSLRS